MDARPTRKRAASAAAKPAAKKVRRSSAIRRSIAESNYVDLANAAYAMDTTGTLTLLATIPQGTSVSQRVGKKVLLKSLQCRSFVTNGSAATVNNVAMLIVYDRRPTGSLPAITDVLALATVNSMNNDVNTGRFQILKREDFVLVGNSTTPATGMEMKTVDFYLPLNKPCVFKAAGTGAIADIDEGALYLITLGSSAAGTAAATLNATFRTRYHDA